MSSHPRTGHRRGAHRSTPPEYGDYATITDSRGKQWTYSQPGDVWRVITGELGPGSVSATSARSWQRLVYEFGPLTAEGGRMIHEAGSDG